MHTFDVQAIASQLRPLFALTLLHPWPYAIRSMGKPIENRVWKPYEFLTRDHRWFALHGAVYPKGINLADAVRTWDMLQKAPFFAPQLDLYDVVIEGVFGLARIKPDLLTSAEGLPPSKARWFQGPFGWEFSDLLMFERPVPMRGGQRLWEVPEPKMNLITSALHTARKLDL